MGRDDHCPPGCSALAATTTSPGGTVLKRGNVTVTSRVTVEPQSAARPLVAGIKSRNGNETLTALACRPRGTPGPLAIACMGCPSAVRIEVAVVPPRLTSTTPPAVATTVKTTPAITTRRYSRCLRCRLPDRFNDWPCRTRHPTDRRAG